MDCRDNELGYMFYQNLSGTYRQSILDSGDPDLALFPTLLSSSLPTSSIWYPIRSYWSGTEFDSGDPWVFDFGSGTYGGGVDPFEPGLSWAVHAGNVGAVPVPAALWLFGSGLLGLVFTARSKLLNL